MNSAFIASRGARQFDAASRDASPSLTTRLSRFLRDFVEKRRRMAEQRRLVAKLAELSDASLLDIGVAEEEIYLIRNLEPFTPRAWTNAHGTARRCGP